MDTIFEVTFYCSQYRHHYPKYEIYPLRRSFADSLEEAEQLIKTALQGKGLWYNPLPGELDHSHHVRIRKYPINKWHRPEYCLAEYIYTPDGKLIDYTDVSSILDESGDYGTFWGRDDSQIRFKEGDIVEVFEKNSIHLGFVLCVPPNKEKAKRINSSAPYHLDCGDDSYVVLTTPNYISSHEHVPSVNIFPPRYRIPAPVANRLRNAYHEFLRLEHVEIEKNKK